VRVEAVRRVQHDLAAAEEHDAHAPLGRAVHDRRQRQRGDAAVLGPDPPPDLLGCLDRRLAEASATQRREEDVLVAPHHTLRSPGGPACVEDVEVVVRAIQRRPFVARRGQRVFVWCGLAEVDVATVLEHDDVPELRELGLDLADQGEERTLDHDRLDIGVLEDVAQLVGDVPVVDVDRD
jgi:hypothetical protein